MRIKTVLNLSLIFFIVLVIAVQSHRAQKITVSGIIVDDVGKPVENALVWLDFSCSYCDVFPGDNTSAEGVFYMETETNAKRVFLFINDREPEGFFSPLFYLGTSERQNIPALRGKTISIYKKRISLGKTVIPFRYGKVIVDLPSIFGESSSKNFVDNINLIIKDEKGRVIDEGILTKAAFDEALTKLKLAMPVRGNNTTWGLKIEYRDAAKNIKTFEYKLTLRKLECRQMSLKENKPVESPCE